MITIALYLSLVGLFIWQAARVGDPWWYGVIAFFAIALMLVVGERISDIFEGILFPATPDAPRVKKAKKYAQPRLVDNSPNAANIETYDGEVVDGAETDTPRLNASNPLPPTRRIANQKSERNGGFFGVAVPMWCDQCKHYPLHIHIDGAWVCQCPWHKN